MTTTIHEQLTTDAEAFGLEVITQGGGSQLSTLGSTATMIAAESEGILRRVAALAGLDIESRCPCPLDAFHRSPNPRRATRIGGTRDSWGGCIVEAGGRHILTVYGATA